MQRVVDVLDSDLSGEVDFKGTHTKDLLNDPLRFRAFDGKLINRQCIGWKSIWSLVLILDLGSELEKKRENSRKEVLK